MPSDEDEELTDPAVCCGDAQLKLPLETLVVLTGGGVTGGGVTGVVPPPEEPPELVVLEEDVEAEADVPSDEPPEHPVIMSAAAIAAADVPNVFIGSASCRNKPLVRLGC